MAVRGIVFLLSGLLLGGCMQATLDPVSDANFTARDRKLLANPPYEKATIPLTYQRHVVQYHREDAQAWSGVAKVGRKEEWPGWTPTEGEKKRLGPLPNYVEGGAHNPMGARGIYLFSGGQDT